MLRSVTLSVVGVALTLSSFWVYFDGLEKVHDLEAALWATIVFLGSGMLLVLGPPVAIVGPVGLFVLYGVRTRWPGWNIGAADR
jgi:4-amino-4-deoxy-L-arabinose transferase-like glycosyltransferase